MVSPYNIDQTASEHLYDGSITQLGGEEVYSGLEVVGTVETGTELIILQNHAIVTSWWSTGINADAPNNIIMRTLVLTRENGCDIDGKKIRVMAREFNDSYAEFGLTMGLGNSTAAIFTLPDLNNETAFATVGAFDCDNVEGYQTIDLVNGNGAQPYYSQWNKGSQTINELYEFTKHIQRRGTAETIHGIGGALFRGITHELDYDNETGALTEDEILAWGTSYAYTTGSGAFTLGEQLTFSPSGATGTLIFDDGPTTGTQVVQLDPNSAEPTASDTVTGVTSTETADVGTVTGSTASGGTGLLLADDTTDTIWFQLLTGSAPVDPLFLFGVTSENSAQVNGTVTSRAVKAEFFGQSTGSSVIGAYGIGVEAADLTSADTLTDLLNATQSPPNNQEFVVSGLVSGEDRVLVAANDGADAVDYDQYALQTALVAGGQTAVVVTGAVEGYTPQIGVIRVELNTSGIYRYVEYTSWTFSTNTTFVTASTDWSSLQADATNDVWIGLIDELASGTTATFTGVYTSDDALLGRVRDGGATPIKPFDTPATWNSSGGSFTAIRTSDA